MGKYYVQVFEMPISNMKNEDQFHSEMEGNAKILNKI